MQYDLSVVIASRNEEFLARTVEDILNKKRGNTEVIVILDGKWASPPIVDHPNVTLVYHAVSIGQRQAVNEGVKLSKAKYIMKLDAHCILDEGFDVKLMADCRYDWTVIPRMYNLHAFDWVCTNCKERKYQGPTPKKCDKCGGKMIREMIWKPRWHKRSDFMRFDSNLKFQYWGALGKRPESQGEIAETMSFVGACFFMNRKRYWDLGGSEEKWGSWGQQGTEWACKSWLSGGKVMVNKKTWFSHLFRTQGLDFGFPYPQSGRQVENARRLCKDMFLNNKFFKQIRPLSWLIEHFKPIPDWHDPIGSSRLLDVMEAGIAFTNLYNKTHGILSIIPSVPCSMTNHTTSVSSNSDRQKMSIPTMGLSSFSSSNTIPSKNIGSIRNKTKMSEITTKPVITNVIQDWNISSFTTRNITNKQRINQPMNPITNLVDSHVSIPIRSSTTSPDPAFSNGINSNFSKDSTNGFGRDFHNTIIPQRSIIYYTDNALNMKIAHTCRKQIANAGLPIVSVSLKPLHFGKNIVLNLKRSYEAYFRQILTALENSTADIIFFCEHDWMYHETHFNFTPPKKDVYYYNDNWWRLRLSDGHAITYNTHVVPSICGYRELLLNHYRKAVEVLEKNNWDKNLVYAIGFEPGTHHRDERVDDFKAEGWRSAYPNLDLRHDNNLTRSKWKQSDFRNQRSCQGWQETDDEIQPWGKTKDIINWFKRS